MDLTVGGRLPGYRDLRELGAGGSGRVVMAVDEHGDSLVAVKYLAEGLAGDARFREEFREEAALLARLECEHVVGLREYAETEDGSAAVVAELVDGVSLRELLRAAGPLEPEAALAVLKGSLLGLACAHEAGVVHRDHRPENVLVTADGVPMLVDFGIAARSNVRPEDGGTAAYLPPERWQHGLVLPSGDIYAATAVFFECLTGRQPYRADSTAALQQLHLQAPIPVEDAPEAVHGLLLRGLAKDHTQRPADGARFAADLQEVAESTYGRDWEARGRKLLAMAVAELAVHELEKTGAPPETALPAAPVPQEETSADGGSEDASEDEGAAPKTAAPVPSGRHRKHRLPVGKREGILLAVILTLVACLIVVLTRPSDTPKTASPVRPSSSSLSAEAAMKTVPNVVGDKREDAERKVQEAGLVPYVTFKQSLEHPEGTVIESDPPAGTKAERNAMVGLVVAQKKPVYAATVPNVVGSPYARAEAAIRDAGLTPKRVDQEVPAGHTAASGEVIATSPAGGTEVERGSQVTVYVAKPNASVVVPNVVSQPQAQAVQTIRNAGLNPVVVMQQNGSVPQGRVISTNPKAGMRVAANTAVTLYVAQAPPVQNVVVPNVASSSYDAAARVLRSAGLVPQRAVKETTEAAEGTAVSTDPPAGSSVKPGSKVTVHVAQAPPLNVLASAFVSPRHVTTDCRRGHTFTFSGSISVSRGPVTVTYRWTRSDGASGPTQSLHFPGTEPQTLPVQRSVWPMRGREYRGWASLQVLTPKAVRSGTADFAYDCRRGRR